MVAAALTVTIAAPFAVAGGLAAVGFGAAGVGAGTVAAGLQAGIGNVVAGSLFAGSTFCDKTFPSIVYRFNRAATAAKDAKDWSLPSFGSHLNPTLARTDLLYMLNWGTQWTMVSYLEK